MDKIASQVAANIYGTSAKIAGQEGKSAGATGDASFDAILKQTATNVLDTMKAGEKMSAEAITGKADINDVVQAVTASEITLQTVVAVRDRLVSSLQDILRMPM